MNRPTGFSLIPPLIKNLIIINAIVYLATALRPGLVDFLALYYPGSPNFRPYQLVTYMFTHGGFFHFLFNMFGLWMLGANVERVWGAKKFFIFYMICGFGSALVHYSVIGAEMPHLRQAMAYDPEAAQRYYMILNSPLVGASGAIYGIIIAFGFLFPDSVLMLLFPPIPMKAKYFVILLVAIDVIAGIFGNDNVAHFAHVGGALVACIILLYWRWRGKLYTEN